MSKRNKEAAELRDHLKESTASVREERQETARRISEKYDPSKIPEAPENFHYGKGEDELDSFRPEFIKLGYLADPMHSKQQALHLQLSGWTRHPRAGHGSWCHLAGVTASWWADVFYRRCGKAVLVLPIAYAWERDHERPAVKKNRKNPGDSAWLSAEELTALLKKGLHPDAEIDDVLNVDLAFMMDSYTYQDAPHKAVYVIKKPCPKLWALTDPKLADPYRAYHRYGSSFY